MIKITDMIDRSERGDVIAYDCEVYPNLAYCGFYSKRLDEYAILPLRNGCKAHLEALVKKQCLLISYNGFDYDNVLIDLCNAGNDTPQEYNMLIVDDGFRRKSSLNDDTYDTSWGCGGFAKDPGGPYRLSVSLKQWEFILGMEMHTDRFGEPATAECFDYNLHDLKATFEVFEKLCKDDFATRKQIRTECKKEGLPRPPIGKKTTAACIDWVKGNLKIGEAPKPGLWWNRLKDTYASSPWKPYYDEIMEAVEYYIKQGMPNLAEVSKKNQVPNCKSVIKVTDIAGMRFSIGSGGIHWVNNKSRLFEGDIIDDDLASMYPNIAINYGIFDDLSPDGSLRERVRKMLDMRLANKRIIKDPNSSPEQVAAAKASDTALKPTLNAIYGKLKGAGGFNHPTGLLGVCVVGQICALEMVRAIVELEGELIQANTDGVFYFNKEGIHERIAEYMKPFGLSVEAERYSKIVQTNVNNYVAVTPEGKHVPKGGAYKDKKGMNEFVYHYLVDRILANGVEPDITKYANTEFAMKCSSNKNSNPALEIKEYDWSPGAKFCIWVPGGSDKVMATMMDGSKSDRIQKKYDDPDGKNKVEYAPPKNVTILRKRTDALNAPVDYDFCYAICRDEYKKKVLEPPKIETTMSFATDEEYCRIYVEQRMKYYSKGTFAPKENKRKAYNCLIQAGYKDLAIVLDKRYNIFKNKSNPQLKMELE
jgi:hypothetical protein